MKTKFLLSSPLSAGKQGIYYADESGARPAIKFLNFADRKVSKIADVESLPLLEIPVLRYRPMRNNLSFRGSIDRPSTSC